MTHDDQLNFVFDICAKKHKGNELSRSAHASIQGAKKDQHRHILFYLAHCGRRGATSYEIMNATGMRQASVSARCSELKALNLITPNGETRKTDSGRAAAVLVLTSNDKKNS